MEKIIDIAIKNGISKDNLYMYGDYVAKINPICSQPDNNKKLILVTAISPTPAGEGKTTTSIGLIDSLNKIGKKCIGALREPSMGPVFGVKGGANGGGKNQIIPKDDINLHFTGDMHAITSLNNLIAACIDNSIYWGNELNINHEKILWKRSLDVNDRSLRQVEITINEKKNIKYKSSFDITVASETMAIFCLANGEDDFINKMNKCIIAYSLENKPVYLSQLNISGAMRKIIKNALLPNIVQTLEGNVSLVHGGPFANIAHGCNSIIALKTAMNIAEYTVTEAGFGSDLGAEKFLDIVCDKANIKPNAIVLVVSIRSLKMHGGVKKEDLSIENTNALVLGFENLKQHIKNISAFNIPYIVSINSFNNDTKKEVEVLEKFLDSNNIVYAFDTSYNEGSKGGIDLANRIVSIVNNNNNSQLTPIYNKTETLEEKVNKICTKCYGASGIEYSDNAKLKLKELNNSNAYVCIAKTPLSLTDDEKILIIDKPFKIHVNDIVVANGADFNIAITGNIYRMPGLPKTPEACNM